MNPNLNELIDELSLLVDGDPDALERWADTLADSDEARDLLFEAQQAARAVGNAGSDFDVPTDLEARVLGALDAREGEAPAPAPVASAPAQAATHSVPSASSAPSTHTASAPSSKRWMVFGLIGTGLAAAAAVAVVVGLSAFRGDPTDPVATIEGALSATVATVVRAADGQQGGVSVGEDGNLQVAAQGAALPAGSRVVTDARTRTQLALSDGSTITLNQDTEVVVGQGGRTVELRRGELLAEVQHLDNGPNAQFQTPSGLVEVIGTKFLLSASDDRASVRVTRGAVRVHGAGESVEVKTGQEGLLARGAAPQVVPAVDLASSVGWSELQGEVQDDVPVPGLGELRANRPGQREQTERPLSLAHHKVTVRIVGNVARTEIEETFRNESGDELEGVYRFPLPPGARIASLALDVDGEWEQGAFVPKDRARQIWRGVIRNATPERQRRQEEFIWVPGPWRDPALLEWQQGGRFELSIFPIPANGERRVRLAYEQTVQPHGDGRRYVYPLAHAEDESTRVGHFEVDVRVAGQNVQAKSQGYEMATRNEGSADRLRYTRNDFRPSGDLVIDYQDPNGDAELRYWTFQGQAVAAPADQTREDRTVADAQRALHGDDRGYVTFALRPELPGWTRAQQRDYVLVVDSSQSMVGERYTRATRLAMGIVAEMDRRDRVVVMACDLACRAMEGDPAQPSSATATAIGEFLEKEDPAGASNLASMLREAVDVAQNLGAGRERALHVVYIGDGTATVGHRRAGSLAAEVDSVFHPESGLAGRLTTVGVGQDADAIALGAMARAGGGHYVPFVPGQRTGAAALAVLETTYGVSLEKATLTLPEGVVAVAPAALPTIRAGEEIMVAARVERDGIQGEVVLRGAVGGQSFEQRYPVNLNLVTSAGNAFVPRMWASKTIEQLEFEGKSEDVPQVVALSRGYGVMSRSTSLLVLESEAMFRAFGVDRARPTLQWDGEEDMVVGQSQALAQLSALGYASPLAGGTFGLTGALGDASGAPAAAASGAGRAALRNRSLDDLAPQTVVEAEALEEPMEEARRRSARMSTRRSRRPPATPGRFGGRWARKVWYSEGRTTRGEDQRARERERTAVRAAEEALRLQPDSRDRHRTLVRALSRAGDLARAEEVARRWLDRDKLDPEALTYLSDVVGRLGRRSEAVRLLSGIVDLEPDNRVLQRRLANAFERAGKAEEACAHRVSLAEIRSNDRELVANAIRCERSLGRADAGERLLLQVDADARERVRTQAARAPTPERVRGNLLLDATWTGGADIDLTLVTPQGTRLSWMGGRTNVVGDDATRIGHERLGLRRAARGSYVIEVNRVSGDRAPIRGEVRVRVLGETQTMPFELIGERVVVGRASVVRRWRIE
ncbi:MAG: VIT domain-containing protein [Myxococcota bacterium]